jgi:hypothetical protein
LFYRSRSSRRFIGPCSSSEQGPLFFGDVSRSRMLKDEHQGKIKGNEIGTRNRCDVGI